MIFFFKRKMKIQQFIHFICNFPSEGLKINVQIKD